MKTLPYNKNGFTLIEILIAMALALIVMSMIYSFFYLQQKTYINQSEITATQQDIVAALHLMEKEIRMAAYDPTGDALAGIMTPGGTNEIKFSYDKNEDGNLKNDSGETLSYSLVGGRIVRTDASDAANPAVLISNVDVFDIVYLDKDKTPTTSLADIRIIQLAIVVRMGREDYNYTDTYEYRNLSGTAILSSQYDHYRRRIMKLEILCRNMGLNQTGGYGGSVIPATS